eukprot:13076717-Alexandrium_andersonii.AAC.1
MPGSERDCERLQLRPRQAARGGRLGKHSAGAQRPARQGKDQLDLRRRRSGRAAQQAPNRPGRHQHQAAG